MASPIQPARILLVDDHALFRTGLRMVLTTGNPQLEVSEAASLEEAMSVPLHEPEVVLLDIQLHGLNGIEGIALIKRRWPSAAVVMLSSDTGPRNAAMALERGAATVVSKASTADHILQVIDQARRGEEFARPETRAFARQGPELAALSPAQRLTPRQTEVLDLLCQGLSNKVIGRRLHLSENTVRGHVQAVLAALEVSSRSEAGFAARRLGLVS